MGKEKTSAEQIINTIRRKTQRKHSAEEKILIVLKGLRGEDSIAELCRREGIAQSLYYKWSKEFLEAGNPAWQVTANAKPPAARSRTCAGRTTSSSRWWRNCC